MKTCKYCGKEFRTDEFVAKTQEEMNQREACFTCNFWINQHDLDINGEEGHHREYAIINRTHYVLLPHTYVVWPRGFGGRRFYIQFNDGRVEMCNNMWCQGDIPSEFDELMPDNATFISEEEYNSLISKDK